jgi:hypothetical protein
MKRRNVLAGGAALSAAQLLDKVSFAQTMQAADPRHLTQDLTPLGGQRAASASGLVPAWTGGVTAPPAGWSPGMPPPDLFADEAPLFTVTAQNMAQYAKMLSAGQILMLQRYGSNGFKMNVYPSHRTAAAPQYVYDNTALNVTRAQPVESGLDRGFTGAVGGTPFPILSDDPNVAGLQAIWNHELRFEGEYYATTRAAFAVGNGQRVLTSGFSAYNWSPYYDPKITPETYAGYYFRADLDFVAPPNIAGGKFQASYSSQPYRYSDSTYEYLTGLGRVRQLPKSEYDTPSGLANNIINYDELYIFGGPPDRYDWKLVGKEEMIVPYNIHKLMMAQPDEILQDNMLNSDLIRWEVHRCHVVEAHLKPGAREPSPFRRFYIDEDTWVILQGDLYDDQSNYWKWAMIFLQVHPDLPGTTYVGEWHFNFQSEQYLCNLQLYNGPGPLKAGLSYAPLSNSQFDPQSLVNSGGL